MRIFTFLLCLLCVAVVAQNNCPAYPKTGKFDTLTFIKTSTPTDPAKGTGIWLGQGTIKRTATEFRPAFIPNNHPEWAIAIAVAWNYSRNIIQRVEYPQIGYWLGTVVQETELACVTGTTWDAPFKASNNMANATIIMNQDGCFQIEGPGSAYGQLNQNYPLGRFPTSKHPLLIKGPKNFETSAMVKSYFDVYTTSVFNNYMGWKVYESIDCTVDPLAYVKTSASGYNGGINAFLGNAGFYDRSEDANACWSGLTATTANYANDVAKWVSVLEDMKSYCQYPTGSTFDSYYNGDMTWTMVQDFLTSISVMYPDVNWPTATAKIQAKFNSLATGGIIKFQKMGDVIDAIILELPRDYPQTVEGSPVGINVFGCSGQKVPYGHFEILNGSQTVCLGSSVTLNMVVDAGGGAAPTFKWYKESTPGTILSTNQSFTITPTAVGSEVYAGEICNAAGCYKINCNSDNPCINPRNICGVKISAIKCSNCTFTATASSVNTPCKGMAEGKINLTLTNAPANYSVTVNGTTPLGTTTSTFNSTGSTVAINNLRDGSYNIILQDLTDPTCKANTTVIVAYTTNNNYYVDASLLSKAACVANLKAEVKELPAPCPWKVRVHVPTFFMWENAVNFGVVTSKGYSNIDRYTRTAPRPEIDMWNDAQIYESSFYLSTGDDMTFKFALTNTPGATMWRDYQIAVFDENNTLVYSKLVPANSAKYDLPYTVDKYKVTCPSTPPSYSFVWSPSLTSVVNTATTSTGSAQVNKTNDVVYTVTATNAAAPACALKDTVVVAKDPSCNAVVCVKPSATISGGASICAGDSTQISVALTGAQPWKIKYSNGATKYIKTGITASPFTFYAKAAGTYSVDSVWDANCDTLGKGSAIVIIKTSPTLTISGDTSICAGETASLTLALTGTAPFSIEATLGAVTTPFNTNLTSYVVPLTLPGQYTVKVTDASGCSVTKKVTVIVSPLPIIDLGADQAICSGASVTLDAGAVFKSYAWSGAKTATTKTITADIAGKYKLLVTDANDCTAKDSINISQGLAVNINFGGTSKTICAGTSVVLKPVITGGSGVFTYKWSNAATGTADTIKATTAGYYVLEVTDDKGCKDKDSVQVTVSASLTVNMPNASICTGDSVILNSGYSGAGYTFLWNTGATTDKITVKAGGPYNVTVTNGSCNGNGGMTLTLFALPNVNLGKDTTLCAGKTLPLNAGTFNSYVWSSGETTNSITKGKGTYHVTVTDINGCKDSDTIVVNDVANPNPDVIVDKQTCPGSPVLLDVGSYNNGNGPYKFKWNTGSTSPIINPTVIITTKYFVEITDKYGCTGTDTANVTVKAKLPVTIVGIPATSMCANSSIKLTSSYKNAAGYTLLWNTGATTDSIKVTTGGPYTLSVSDAGGCSGTDNVTVVVNASPNKAFVSKTASICSGAAATIGFDYGPGHTYLWTGGSIAPTISVTNSGVYNVKITNSFGCYDTVNVTVTTHNNPVVSLRNDIDTCAGNSIELKNLVPQTGVTYVWTKASSGTTPYSTAMPLSITTSDTYTLKGTNAFGCSASDVLVANFRKVPVVELIDRIDTAFICGKETLTLNAGNAETGITYMWLPGKETSQVITVGTTGDYSVTVSNGICKASDKVHVRSVVLPTGVLNDSLMPIAKNYCFAEEKYGVTISAMGKDGFNYNYHWNTGDKTSSIKLTKEGTYIVNVSQGKCSVLDSVKVIDYCQTYFYLPNSFTPNGDAKNDVFKVFATNAEVYEITIFNRWGNVVYTSKDVNQPWDGTYHGQPVQQDVYIVKLQYSVNLENGHTSTKERISTVTVIY